MTIVNLVTPEAGAKRKLLFNKPATVHMGLKVNLHVRFQRPILQLTYLLFS
jgi:hypothetical protein